MLSIPSEYIYWLVKLVFVYFVTWWLVFYILLPIRIVGKEDVDSPEVIKGEDRGAPVRNNLKLKVQWTFILNIPVSLIMLYILHYSLILSYQ